MSQIKPTSAAKIAAAIVADLEARTGFKELFLDISAGVKNEIQERIVTLVTDAREAAAEPQQPTGNVATKAEFLVKYEKTSRADLLKVKESLEASLKEQPDYPVAKAGLEAITELLAKAK